ncbi:MAG: cell division protein ZapE [Hellea sp.]|nr:cell division protein ZapE [Hellea sp.]
MSVLAQLKQRISNGELIHDEAQICAAKALDDLLHRLQQVNSSNKFFWKKKRTPKGLYLWGGVGRGKSMLMDWFFDELDEPRKARVHFHAFMLDVHDRITNWRKLSSRGRKKSENYVRGAGDDPIAPVAKSIARDAMVLCFDEFHVTDIADAMILSRLFAALWDNGVVVVATSNRPTEGLYKNGLNRALFEPFIDLMEDHLIIHEFEGEIDHRLRQLTAAPVYYTPLGEGSEIAIEAAWNRMTGAAIARPMTLKVQGRELKIENTAAGVARTTFDRLCGRPLGAADYLKLAHSYQTLILENVPQMGEDMRNEAKRFVTLIDALYETRTKLVMSAAVEPANLYPAGDGSFEFERTVSRLMEMRSEDYLGARRNFGVQT